MEKNRDTKLILVTVLAVGVMGLSIGFAAFSNVLKINSAATVSPDASTFNVDFSSSESEVETNPIVPEITQANTPEVTPAVSLAATNAVIDNSSDPTITN